MVSFRLVLSVAVALALGSANLASAAQFTIRGIKGLWWDGIAKYQEALPWLAEHDLNFLMFCYTSWPASASDWRSDYTPAQYQQFRDLAAQAESLNVTLCHSFNPGIWSNPPLTYSSEQDYQKALIKVQRVHAAGIRWFALCLDDINTALQPADISRFGTLQAAHVYFVNRLWNDIKTLSPQPKLIFCPSAYTTQSAIANRNYIDTVGAGIDSAVLMFWTGPTVCSASITAADANQFASLIKRKPFVWDNYPVNDMFNWRLLLGPLKNRAANLPGAVSGYIANPMKQWHASTIPLATTAAYLNDPSGYNPTAAMDAAINAYPADQRQAIRLLVEVYGSSFWGEPGFPSAPDSGDSNLAEALQKLEEIQQRCSQNPGLAVLWADVREQVEKDLDMVRRVLTQQDRWKTSPLKATGADFIGGAGDLFGYTYLGRPVNYVYAIPTGRNEMHIDFHLDSLPGLGAVLRLVGLDDDYPEMCSIHVTINGYTLAAGDSMFSSTTFQEKSVQVPASFLRKGLNRLSIRNTEPTGILGMPPWFMVAEAELIPRGFVRLPAEAGTVNLRSVVVTAAFPDCFYVESDDRCTGVRVSKTGHGMSVGDRVDVTGTLGVAEDGERCIEASQVAVSGSGTIAPLAVNNAALGGGTQGLQQGVWGWLWRKEERIYEWTQIPGLNNIGLLVRTWGKVLTEGASKDTFVIDDGSSNLVTCILPSGMTFDPSWRSIVVTGISSCVPVGAELHRAIRIRSADDVQPIL